MGSTLDHSSIINSSIMSPIEAVVAMSSLESEVVPTMGDVVYQKFGEMELHEEEEEDDGDYCPSEADSDDSLERAGAKGIEGGVDSSPSIITDAINSVLSYLGFSLVPAVEDSSKPHLEPGTEPFTPEQEFGEMTLP